MTNEEILTQFEGLIDDNLDQTLEIQLANNAKNKLETELKLAICEKLDTSLTSTVGGTYTTAYTLQTDFLMLSKDIIYVGTALRTAIPLAHREAYKNDSSKFYIDYRQGKLYLCGTVAAAETITIPYLYTTTDISDANLTSTSIIWPVRFHSLIAYEMAKIWFAVDQGDKSRSWTPEWTVIYNDSKGSLIDWDAAIKLSAIGGATPYGEDSSMRGENRINL